MGVLVIEKPACRSTSTYITSSAESEAEILGSDKYSFSNSTQSFLAIKRQEVTGFVYQSRGIAGQGQTS